MKYTNGCMCLLQTANFVEYEKKFARGILRLTSVDVAKKDKRRESASEDLTFLSSRTELQGEGLSVANLDDF